LARAELRLHRHDSALQIFDELRAQHPAIPELAGAFFENARLLLDDRQFDAAAVALDSARALHPDSEMEERIAFLSGRIDYAAGKFDAAAKNFQRIALVSRKYSTEAWLNESFAALRAGDGAQFAAADQQLKEHSADDAARGEVMLEQALAQAAHGEKNATDSLRNFITNFPKHPRISEAWVALAELAFHASPPRLDEARQDLKHAAESQPTVAAQERSDYLNIWLEEAATSPNESKIVELANEFLQNYGDSPVANDVRLKLAEIYYRQQDFASAQTQFTLLAQQNPNGALTEKAQFFAAQSARQSMATGALERALVLFDEVVKKNGEMKWAARNEQAIIERRLGKNDDALTLYEEVLKGDAKNAEKREALCGKGDTLYDLGAANSENYKRAAEIYTQLAKQTEVGSHWHNQALCKKGMCEEKLNAPDEALATFYQIVEDGSRPDKRREFFWFYKAGFNAARLLEEKSSWQPAAAIYQKLAFAGGPRSEEAKARLKQLRLEHYLWEP
ncbi:MAG: tetratricopeptide repeat protein, partial [Verrucomicrobiota bacterium]|nr:tetratricopeptide repeat protein [Verrucomicrobiota bacterium]